MWVWLHIYIRYIDKEMRANCTLMTNVIKSKLDNNSLLYFIVVNAE